MVTVGARSVDMGMGWGGKEHKIPSLLTEEERKVRVGEYFSGH